MKLSILIIPVVRAHDLYQISASMGSAAWQDSVLKAELAGSMQEVQDVAMKPGDVTSKMQVKDRGTAFGTLNVKLKHRRAKVPVKLQWEGSLRSQITLLLPPQE